VPRINILGDERFLLENYALASFPKINLEEQEPYAKSEKI